MDVRSSKKYVGLLAIVVVGCEYLPSLRQPLARPEIAGDVHINDGRNDQLASGDLDEGSELTRMIERDIKALQDIQNHQPLYRRQQQQLLDKKQELAAAKNDTEEVAKASTVVWQSPQGRLSKIQDLKNATRTPDIDLDTLANALGGTNKKNSDVVQDTLAIDLPNSIRTNSSNPDQSYPYPLSDALRQMIVDFRGEVFHNSSYSNNPLRELLVLAALPLVDPDGVLSQDTIEAINGLTDREREIFGKMQDFYVSLGQQLLYDADSEEAVITGLTNLISSLSSEPQLELHHPMLCTSVSGFGAYKAFGKNTEGGYAFLSQTSQQAVVYIEVDNFTSELNENSKWVTKLSQKLVIYNDKDGIPVWKQDWRPVVDVTENKRKDFFVVQVITLTERLGLGRYQLKISLRDELSGAESETVIELEMVADPSLVTAGVMR